MQMTDDNHLESWILSIFLFLADIPRYHECSSWRLLLIWYLDPILLIAMIACIIHVGTVPTVYFLYSQLLFGLVLVIACLVYTPLDESAQENDPNLFERTDSLATQDFLGKFLCVNIALWMLSWSLCYWKAMPIFVCLSYSSFKLSIVYLLHLRSIWDSHLPEVQLPVHLLLYKSEEV